MQRYNTFRNYSKIYGISSELGTAGIHTQGIWIGRTVGRVLAVRFRRHLELQHTSLHEVGMGEVPLVPSLSVE